MVQKCSSCTKNLIFQHSKDCPAVLVDKILSDFLERKLESILFQIIFASDLLPSQLYQISNQFSTDSELIRVIQKDPILTFLINQRHVKGFSLLFYVEKQ